MKGKSQESSNRSVISWLLGDDQPVVQYYTLLDLLDRSSSDPEVKEAYSNITRRGWAFELLNKQKPQGNWESKTSVYRPKYTSTNWIALVLSDFGLTNANLKIRKTSELLFKEWLQQGKENIFEDEVCVVGNTARMLSRFGYADDPRVRKLFDRLVEDQKEDGGWHCWDSKGTLDCWEALAAFGSLPKQKRSRKIKKSIERGAEFYLERKLFDDGEPRYLPWFRLHYPVHYYYDILVGLDVLTRLGYGGDKRLGAALKILEDKRRSDGTWLLDAIHPDPPSYAWGKRNLKWKVKPFALERASMPSKWITLASLRILKRVEEYS